MLLATALGLSFLFRALCSTRPALAEAYVQRVFGPLARLGNALQGPLPFSLSEILLLLLLVGGPVAVGLWLVGLLRGKAPRGYLFGRGLLRFVNLVLLLGLLFMLMHGINYARLPLERLLDLPAAPVDLPRLVALLQEEQAGMQALREGLKENEDGVFDEKDGRWERLRQAHLGLSSLATEHPFLQLVPQVHPKPLITSELFSWMGIAGIYSPFLAEAQVNVRQGLHEQCFTALHELAHVQGFAREGDANFYGFLAGYRHPDPRYQYAARLHGYQRLLRELERHDPAEAATIRASLSPQITKDLRASHVYWQAYEGPVQEQASKLNDRFLKANRQAEGIQSYQRDAALILAYLFQEETRAEGRP